MTDPADERLAWLALDAARVPGRARAAVLARGAGRVLEDGGLVLESPRVQLGWDARAAVETARQALGFVEAGGLTLGGPNGEALGRAETRRRPPLFLYARGEASLLLARHAVAIVGSRRATPVGLTRTRRLAEALTELGAVVVSGGAKGIDRAAHEAALDAGGESVAVLGQPILPGRDERRHWMCASFGAAAGRALSVTPYGPGVPNDPRLFAARNWTLAALADAVVVVEGAVDSGTRHTAVAARALEVPVFTWPSDVERATSSMPNQLLAEGRARPLPNDARDAAALVLGLAGPRASAATRPDPPLVAALRAAGGRLLVDEAAVALGVSAEALAVLVAELELDGQLAREGPALLLR